MAYKVVITEDADRDLDRILSYLTQQLYSEQAASTLVAEYAQVLEQLEQFPSMFEVAHSVSRSGKETGNFCSETMLVFTVCRNGNSRL